MKSSAMAMCLMCFQAFCQEPGMTPREALLREDMVRKIAIAVRQHQSFRFPDDFLGPNVMATATDVTADGHKLTLTGVEIIASNLIITSDQVIYDLDTCQIEPRGNVRLKSAPAR